MSYQFENTAVSIRYRAGDLVATTLALITCYGTLALASALTAVGITLEINEGLWAVAIVLLFGLAASLIAFRGGRRFGPARLALLAFALILWVMFASYHWATELVAFAALISAAFWKRATLNTQMQLRSSNQHGGIAPDGLTHSSAM